MTFCSVGRNHGLLSPLSMPKLERIGKGAIPALAAIAVLGGVAALCYGFAQGSSSFNPLYVIVPTIVVLSVGGYLGFCYTRMGKNANFKEVLRKNAGKLILLAVLGTLVAISAGISHNFTHMTPASWTVPFLLGPLSICLWYKYDKHKLPSCVDTI